MFHHFDLAKIAKSNFLTFKRELGYFKYFFPSLIFLFDCLFGLGSPLQIQIKYIIVQLIHLLSLWN